jgi:hypothetical protein
VEEKILDRDGRIKSGRSLLCCVLGTVLETEVIYDRDTGEDPKWSEIKFTGRSNRNNP